MKMAVDIFHKQGALDPKELGEFIADYKRNGGHRYEDRMNLDGCEKDPVRFERIVNGLGRDLSNAVDRLALTLIKLIERGMDRHAENCTIYSSFRDGNPQHPEAGVCTCGYGLHVMRETKSDRELYSRELRDSLLSVVIVDK